MRRSTRTTVTAILVGLSLVAMLLVGIASASASPWPSDVPSVAVATERIAGPDRYSTAVAIAEKTYPAWAGVSDVIIASGEDRAAADPLTAASLCWAYDAPLLLTSSARTPASTLAALAAIVSANSTVTVHVVGGPGSVPAARITELRRVVGNRGTVEQPWVTGDRYTVARGIADRTRLVASLNLRAVPDVVFVANGERPATFWDVLAVSAVSRHMGIPVLLTKTRTVPASTLAALQTMPRARRIVVGGPATVAPAVYSAVGASERWSGADRYATASAVATGAAEQDWVDTDVFAVAVAMPDAVAGAGLVGRQGGVLLLSGRERIARPTWQLLSDPRTRATRGYLLGGTGSATPALLDELNGAPAMPALGTTTPSPVSGPTARIAGSVGGNTTTVSLFIDGVLKGTQAVAPWGSFDFETVAVPMAGLRVSIVAGNPDGQTATLLRGVARKRWVVCIDPGHQARGNSTLEPIGPGSTIKKPAVSSGATGVGSRVPEYKITLQIALKLKQQLEARGVTVVMTRTSNDVNITNSARAKIANNAHANLFVRVHCDGSTTASVKGISTLYPASNQWTKPIAARSKTAAGIVQSSLIRATGATNRGAIQRSDLTGFNWATVPSVLVESGFLSNRTEDALLVTSAYQDKIAAGMAEGVMAYLATGN